MWSNAVGCCEFHFYGFFIINISVCFLEKVKIWYAFIALFIFIFSLMLNIFFFTEHAVSLWNRVVLARRFLSQRWPLSMTEEGLPSTFFSILILATHAHLTSLLLNTICFTSLASFWTTSVIASVRCYAPAVTHHGIMPRYPTIDLFS